MKSHAVIIRCATLFVSALCLAGCTQHSLTITIEGSGSTDPSAGVHKYGQGTSVAVTATGASGWAFDHWEGMLSGSGNPATVILNSDISVTAVFTQSQGGEGEGEAEGESEGEGEDEGEGESVAVNMATIPALTYTMGALDSENGRGDELPRHPVQLTSFQIMKFDVTNIQFAGMLNWAQSKGYLKTNGGQPYDGDNDIYYANKYLASVGYSDNMLDYNSTTNLFFVPPRDEMDMSQHPVEYVTWYGAAVYCNWLSQRNGLTPCYNTLTWDCNTGTGGYHLPTEAQWECAAGWDKAAAQHWVYAFNGNTVDATRANCELSTGDVYINPLGLSGYPYTTPVGWFNGVNVNPNGGFHTADSSSPSGLYDMSGSMGQWCNDWYKDDYYSDCQSLGTVSNPTGPAQATSNGNKVVRGGSWYSWDSDIRTARRFSYALDNGGDDVGFRVARY